MIAQELKAECKDAAEAMQRAELLGAKSVQDWFGETTTFTFEDGSRLIVSGPTFDLA
jgi:hypothetical protein